MRTGDSIEVRVHKFDGKLYRWWLTTVERVEDDRIVTVNRAGDRVHGPGGGWGMSLSRAVYWLERPYNLVEMYLPSGALKQTYIHIASPASVEDGAICYQDHELDVVKRPGQPLRIMDEDEFDAAGIAYGYSPEFQQSCRAAVSEAMEVAANWRPGGPPRLVNRRGRNGRFRSRSKSKKRVAPPDPPVTSRTSSHHDT